MDLAAYHGRPLILAALIEAAGPDATALVNEYKDGSFFTLLHTAVRDGCVECVKVLLRAGADVARGGSSYPGSPMECAVCEGGRRRRVYPILLAAGATIPPDAHDAYLRKVRAVGFPRYQKAHRQALATKFAAKAFPRLPVEVAAQVVAFAFHVGYY